MKVAVAGNSSANAAVDVAVHDLLAGADGVHLVQRPCSDRPGLRIDSVAHLAPSSDAADDDRPERTGSDEDEMK